MGSCEANAIRFACVSEDAGPGLSFDGQHVPAWPRAAGATFAGTLDDAVDIADAGTEIVVVGNGTENGAERPWLLRVPKP